MNFDTFPKKKKEKTKNVAILELLSNLVIEKSSIRCRTTA